MSKQTEQDYNCFKSDPQIPLSQPAWMRGVECLDKEEGSPELKGQRKREGDVVRGGGTRIDKHCACLPKCFQAQV